MRNKKYTFFLLLQLMALLPGCGRQSLSERSYLEQTSIEGPKVFTLAGNDRYPTISQIKFKERKIFNNYFRFSNEGTVKLKYWWRNKDKINYSNEFIYDTIRQGFSGAEELQTEIIKWLGLSFRRGDPDPEAIEIMYYSSYKPKIAYDATYFGLSIASKKKPERIIKRLAELSLYNDNCTARCIWSAQSYSQEEEFVATINLLQNNPNLYKKGQLIKGVISGEIDDIIFRKITYFDYPKLYFETYCKLYEAIEKEYPFFELKNIDWEEEGYRLSAKLDNIKDDSEFGLLCMELIAKLKDSHSQLLNGESNIPDVNFPKWDCGFACLEDNNGQAVIYYLDPEGPALKAGVKIGMIVQQINSLTVDDAIKKASTLRSRYVGYSSQRYLDYHAYRFFVRQKNQGDIVKLKLVDIEGNSYSFALPAILPPKYIPRLPVPIEGINESENISWKILENNIGYIYVRRIKQDLISLLDKAVEELSDSKAIIIDIRGNSGGGYDSKLAHLNFNKSDKSQENKPQYDGPLALLIDSRCISAAEGWASWFIADKRAVVFGTATAGASSRKKNYTLKNRLYKAKYSIKGYKGSLYRLIEQKGLEPDFNIKPKATDIASGRDTVLEAAKEYFNHNFISPR